MSVIAYGAAIVVAEKHDLSPASAAVLYALAWRHHQETGRCDPSVAHLAAITRLSERAVRNALRNLEKLRLIKTTFRKVSTGRGKRNRTNRYRLNFAPKGGARGAGGMGHEVPGIGKPRDVSQYDDLAMLLED